MRSRPLRIALSGIGKIGRELVKRTLTNTEYFYVAMSDRSGVVAKQEGFTEKELNLVLNLKESGRRLGEYGGVHTFHGTMAEALGRISFDVLIDVTDIQTHDLLLKALDYAHVITSNKLPIADVPYRNFQRIVSKARELKRILDYGTTVGAGMRIPDIIRALGTDDLYRVEGCLSGTMSYLSQRLNQGVLISQALREAMEPPRSYTEPDPRVDLGGEDFARKLVIVGRTCGKPVERSMIKVEDIVPKELKGVLVEEFMRRLPSVDGEMALRIESAKKSGKALWYLGTADLEHDDYQISFEEIPLADQMTNTRESENVVRIHPRLWRRPVTVIGPGAGVPETVTGLMAALPSIPRHSGRRCKYR